MEAFGRVENGVVVLEEPAELPDGARVRVSYSTPPRVRTATEQRRVVLPIFDYNEQPDIGLTNERIAEILDRDDASA